MGGGGGGVEKWRLKLTSAKVVVEVEAELGNFGMSVNTTVVAMTFSKTMKPVQ